MNKVAKLSVLITFAVLILIIAGCFLITSVSQPLTVMGLQQFTAAVTVQVTGTSDPNPHYGIVGIKVPNDWQIDSVWYSGGYTNHCAYLPPDVPDNEPGGQVDFWTDSLEARYPTGASMKWVVYQSVTSHPVLESALNVTLSIKMTPGVTQGVFNLGYFTSHAGLDFTDPSYYSASLNNQITVSGILPVELTSFEAVGTKNGVQLNWVTASETNNKGFEIERSVNKENYAAIGYVSGNGTTTQNSSYSFTDQGLNSGKYFYRLKQIDFNGMYEYSKVVEIEFTVPNEFKLVQNYPNPFNPSTVLSFGLPVESDITLSVFNSLGELIEVVAQGKYQAGTHSVNFQALNLTTGIYLYTLSAAGSDGTNFTQTAKMLLIK
jgi:hypothetical protein